MFTKDNTLNAPLGEWCQQITFSNSNAASEAIVSPVNWTIGAGGTIQLHCEIRNADGIGWGPVFLADVGHDGHNDCQSAQSRQRPHLFVNSTGLVTATSGINFGLCIVTVTVSGIMTPSSGPTISIYGMVNASPGPIPHFGSDGQIHTTCTGASDCIWVADSFNTTSTSAFGDPLIQNRLTLFANPFAQAGFNTMGVGAGTPAWITCTSGGVCPSQSSFTTNLNAAISAVAAIANTYHVYYHPILTGVMDCAGAGDAMYPSADAFWDFTLGHGLNGVGGSNLTSPGVSQMAAAWQATGFAMGFSGADEVNANAATYPGPNGVIGSAGGPVSITTDSGSPPTATITWPSLTFTGGPYFPTGLDYAGCNHHIRISGTGTALDNGSSPFNYNLGSGGTFTAPSGATNLTVTSGTINTFGWNNEDGAGSFQPNSIWNTFMTQFRAASPHPVVAQPVANGQNFDNVTLSPQWCGNSTFSDDCEIYIGIGRTNTPQNDALMDLINLRPGSNAITGSPAYKFRAVIGNAGSQRAFLGQTGGILANYYMFQPNSLSGVTCSGDTCTFPTDHGIRNIVGHCGTQLYVSGSSNADWNATFCVSAAPTSTTLKVAREGAHVSPGEGIGGQINWADGTTSTLTNITVTTTGSGHIDNFNLPATDHCIHNGQNFTITGNSVSYYNTTNFYSPSTMVPLPDPNCGTTSKVMEYLPSGDASGTISVQLYPDAEYHKGLYSSYESSYGGSSETLTGPYQGPWIVWQSAMARGGGTRLYDNIGPYNSFTSYGGAATVVNTTAPEFQPSVHPFYNNGDSGMIPAYWSNAAPQLLLQRLAQAGYLYGTPAANGCPGIGFWFDCDLRSSYKGNLLMVQSAFGAPISRTVDISGCAVSGQPTIRYIADSINGITVSTIASGTTSDTPTFPTGGTVVYLCSNNEAAELSEPVMSLRLADITGAASIELRYAHTPYALGANLANVVSMGTGSGTIAWDRNIGTLYYRLLYLNSSGFVAWHRAMCNLSSRGVGAFLGERRAPPGAAVFRGACQRARSIHSSGSTKKSSDSHPPGYNRPRVNFFRSGKGARVARSRQNSACLV